MINKIKKITLSLNTRFISEAHFIGEIYHQLRADLDINQVRLEEAYPETIADKCDIFVQDNSGDKIWIECKGYFAQESRSTISGKHTGKKSTPLKDCAKMSTLPSKDKKVLIVYQNCRPKYEPKKSGHSWSEIKDRCVNANIEFIHHHPTKS